MATESDVLDRIVAAVDHRTARGIAGAISRLVSSGELPPGMRLPTVRSLSRALGASPTTVSYAWQSLIQAGALTARGRNGTFVSSVHPADGARRTLRTYESPGNLALDLSTGIPDPRLLPDLTGVLGQVRSHPNTASYIEPPVLPELEGIVRAEWPFVPENVTVVNGALDALARLTSHLVRMGDRVMVENPCFPPLLDLLEMAGAEVIGLPVDRDGPQIDPMKAALSAEPVALYLQSRAHNPTGVSLSARRAAQVGRLLHRTQVTVIEDDHAGEISSSPLVSVGSHLPAQTVHIRSFSKSHGPDLRLAAIGGAGDVIDDLNHRRLLSSGWSSRLLQAVLVALLTDDATKAGVADARRIYAGRRAEMAARLQERGVVTTGRDGINLWVEVSNEQRALVVLAAAGIGVAPGSPFLTAPLPESHIRVTVGLVQDADVDRVVNALVLAAGSFQQTGRSTRRTRSATPVRRSVR